MKAFGCAAFAHVPKALRQKSDSKEPTMLFFCDESKACVSIVGRRKNTKKVVISSRDVAFDERRVPGSHRQIAIPELPSPSPSSLNALFPYDLAPSSVSLLPLLLL